MDWIFKDEPFTYLDKECKQSGNYLIRLKMISCSFVQYVFNRFVAPDALALLDWKKDNTSDWAEGVAPSMVKVEPGGTSDWRFLIPPFTNKGWPNDPNMDSLRITPTLNDALYDAIFSIYENNTNLQWREKRHFDTNSNRIATTLQVLMPYLKGGVNEELSEPYGMSIKEAVQTWHEDNSHKEWPFITPEIVAIYRGDRRKPRPSFHIIYQNKDGISIQLNIRPHKRGVKKATLSLPLSKTPLKMVRVAHDLRDDYFFLNSVNPPTLSSLNFSHGYI